MFQLCSKSIIETLACETCSKLLVVNDIKTMSEMHLKSTINTP